MANNKSPGTDGLPTELYKRYGESLLPTLLTTLNVAVCSGALLSSMREAIIVVLLKPSKDLLLPNSYRPISLINRHALGKSGTRTDTP